VVKWHQVRGPDGRLWAFRQDDAGALVMALVDEAGPGPRVSGDVAGRFDDPAPRSPTMWFTFDEAYVTAVRE
jgi:hypothetical protein